MTHSWRERSVDDFLEAVASDTEPVPAGACVAAVTGAGAAGLVVLVSRVLGKRADPPSGAHDIATRAEALQTQLVRLIDADAAAYQAFIDARKLPAGDTRQTALAAATRPPLNIAAACAEVAQLARQLAQFATGSVVSDTRVSTRLAVAAGMAALDTAAQNVAGLEQGARRDALQHEVETLRASLAAQTGSSA